MKRIWSAGKFRAALIAAVILAGVVFWISTRPRAPEGNAIGAVTRGDLVQRVTVAGVASPIHRTIISAQYAGYVHKLFVKVGQKVKAGDPVVSITQSFKGANEQVFPLRASFAGTVVEILKTEGEYVEQGLANPVVRIDDMTQMNVEASAPESEIAKLKVGQEAVIKAAALPDRPYRGVIDEIALASKDQKDWDRSRVEFPLKIRVLDADRDLRPGMSVVLDVITKHVDNVLTLPHEYIQKDGDKYFVIDEAGAKHEIKVGMQNEEAFEIKSGAPEGMRVRLADFLNGGDAPADGGGD